MGFWKLIVGESIVWMTFNLPQQTPDWWCLGYLGTAIVVGITSFIDI